MDASFWHARWQDGLIGFHEASVNRHLAQHWTTLDAAEGSRVLVPLCGKSLDLLFLRDWGHDVVGVELSPVAVAAFFQENQIPHEIRHEEGLRIWEADRLTLYEGDILAVRDLGAIAGIYDRAATIALPPDMRERYAQHLAKLTAPGAQMLLITMDYPHDEKSGPPFSVPPAEVARLYADAFDIRELATRDLLAEDPERFGATWGLSRARSIIWQLTRRSNVTDS